MEKAADEVPSVKAPIEAEKPAAEKPVEKAAVKALVKRKKPAAEKRGRGRPRKNNKVARAEQRRPGKSRKPVK